tara:strand:+ start:77 stop:376 length:300 start_codon:yes stop_codon:yes gene_type:complete
MGFSLIGVVFKLFFVGSLVTSGSTSALLSATSTVKTIYDQALLSKSNPTLEQRGLALLPFGTDKLFKSDSSLKSASTKPVTVGALPAPKPTNPLQSHPE